MRSSRPTILAACAARPPYRLGGHAGAHACAPFGFDLRRMFPPKQSFCGAFRDPTVFEVLAYIGGGVGSRRPTSFGPVVGT